MSKSMKTLILFKQKKTFSLFIIILKKVNNTVQSACNFLIIERSLTSVIQHRLHSIVARGKIFLFQFPPIDMQFLFPLPVFVRRWKITRQQINNNANVSLIHCETLCDTLQNPCLQSPAQTRNSFHSERKNSNKKKNNEEKISIPPLVCFYL